MAIHERGKILNVNDKIMELVDKNSELFTGLIFPLEGKMKLLATIKGNKSQWLNGNEVCHRLKISTRTLQSYRDEFILPYSCIRAKLYNNEKHIEELLRKNNTTPRK